MELLSVTMNDGVVKRSQIEGKDNSSEDKSNYKIVRSGDLVYNSMRMWQGANGISKYDGIVSPAYTVLKAVEEIDEGYFAALFKTVKLINEFRKNSQGLTSDTWNLKYPQIAGIRICIPKIGEQHKISSFLQFLDKRIDAQRRLVEALKSYKRGVTKAIFNPNSVYQNCAESWRLRKVSELLSYEQPQKYIVQTEHYSSNYATPVLTANKGFILGYTNETTGVYDKGDVVIYDDFTMDMKYVDFPFKVKSSTIKFLTAKPGNNLYFLFCLLQSLSLTPEGHQRSYISKVEQMNVFVPSVDEQSRIAGILKKVTVILERHEFALHKLEMLKAGLLNQLFI